MPRNSDIKNRARQIMTRDGLNYTSALRLANTVSEPEADRQAAQLHALRGLLIEWAVSTPVPSSDLVERYASAHYAAVLSALAAHPGAVLDLSDTRPLRRDGLRFQVVSTVTVPIHGGRNTTVSVVTTTETEVMVFDKHEVFEAGSETDDVVTQLRSVVDNELDGIPGASAAAKALRLHDPDRGGLAYWEYRQWRWAQDRGLELTQGTTCLCAIGSEHGRANPKHKYGSYPCSMGQNIFDHLRVWRASDSSGRKRVAAVTAHPYLNVEQIAPTARHLADRFSLAVRVGDPADQAYNLRTTSLALWNPRVIDLK